MPLELNFFERMALLKANLGPGPMVDLFGPLAFKAVLTALRLGLFEALEQGPATAAECAERIHCSERGVRFLLQALEPLGYVEFRDGCHANSKITQKWLLQSAKVPLGDLFEYFDDMIGRWDHLPESIRQGAPTARFEEKDSDNLQTWDRFHGGMLAISRLLCDEILSRTKIPPSCKRLLDLGGSHGLYAARFCAAHPWLEATIFDGATARPLAEETIAAEGVQERVSFQAGDFLQDDIGQGWDVVLLFNTIRSLSEDDARWLLRRLAEATTDDGMVVIMDQLVDHPRSRFARANARLIDLELMNTSQGDIYRADQVSAWLPEAGFPRLQYVALRRASGQGLIVARK